MGWFIYGLAVALLIFEGIIIQCEGTGGGEGARIAEGSEGPSSSNQEEDVPTSDSEKTFLPEDLIKKIFYKIKNTGRQTILEDGTKRYPDLLMSVLLQNCIIVIKTNIFDETDSEVDRGFDASLKHENGDVALTFNNYEELVIFLEKYGKHVTKIHITMNDYEPRILTILKKCENNLEELRISSVFDDEQFWKELSNGNKFPKMKTLVMTAWIKLKNFKLNKIFPELEYLTLDGIVTDEDCLANMEHLKELTLRITSIPEKKLESIFQKNNGMTMIGLREPKMRETMQSLAQHLKNLKELVFSLPGENFLLQEKGDPKCEFPNVEKLTIFAGEIHKLCEIEKLRFKMPKLQELTLYIVFDDDRLVEFIEHFERLEILRLPNYGSELLQRVEQTWIYSKVTRIGNCDYLEFKKSNK